MRKLTLLVVSVVCAMLSVLSLVGNAQSPRSDAQMQKQSRETEKEIALTKSRLSENREQISRGVAELSRLEADINDCRRTVADMSRQVKTLDGRIGSLTGKIASGEKELEGLRQEYAKSVKKMRLARGRHSALAFIFSAKSFNQAMRRLRYLREFSSWREKQNVRIRRSMGVLREQTVQLSAARRGKEKALKAGEAAEREIAERHRQQNVVVADLRRHGEELRQHLAEKQREADALRSSISALIAQEEARKAEQARKAKKLVEERAAREKAAREKAAAEKGAREKAAADKAAREKAAAEKGVREKAAAEKAAREKAAKESAAKKTVPKKETAPKKEVEKQERSRNASGADYAKARGREPRKPSAAAATTPANKEAVKEAIRKGAEADGFASMRGSLPKPVSGSFRILTPFGRHSLPDLPGVMYDNPGIDAETSDGARAQAVYAGKVSGIYSLPGYHNVVIINHGSYYTVYGNISSPSVSKGQSVKAGQQLGALARDPDHGGKTMIHFEVWRNREKLNPAEWIR